MFSIPTHEVIASGSKAIRNEVTVLRQSWLRAEDF
jgi:hypothetical protein